MAKIFKRVKAPTSVAKSPINAFATWYTWSNAFLSFFRDALSELHQLPRPSFISIPKLNDYNLTYTLPTTKLKNPKLRRQCAVFAKSLYLTRPDRRLIFFDGILTDEIKTKEIHTLFALLRGAIIELTHDERAALYSPLADAGRKGSGGEFPLHADLYVPQILLNIFNNVPTDNSGASTFLSITALRKLLPSIKLLPTSTANRIILLLSEISPRDHFNSLYDLLHGEHKWVPELEKVLKQQQLCINLHSGQGYLLDDRKWLHGREALRSVLPANRIHRLVYGLPIKLAR